MTEEKETKKEEKICPLMSKRNVQFPAMGWQPCLEERCALWVKVHQINMGFQETHIGCSFKVRVFG